MSFHPYMAQLVKGLEPLELKSVCELGNQTFRGGVGGIRTTEEYYKSLGFLHYVAIDINTRYGSIIMDLNHDLESEYGYTDQFDLVTNNGTGEHLFNQYMVFRNVHKLCREDGYMLHVLPFVNWMNHGFYNFHPLLFADLATANDYELTHLEVGNRDGVHRIIKAHCYLSEPVMDRDAPIKRAVQSVQEAGNPNVFVAALMRKVHDKPFRMPIQGKYHKDIEDGRIREEYR